MRSSREKYFGHLPIEENSYKADFIILEKYQQYSSEILRIALLTLAIIGYLPKLINDSKQCGLLQKSFQESKSLFIITVVLLIVSVCSCLAHRYFSSDNMTHHIRKLRLRNKFTQEINIQEKEKIEKKIQSESKSFENDLDFSKYSLIIATFCLVAGISFMFITLIKIFFA